MAKRTVSPDERAARADMAIAAAELAATLRGAAKILAPHASSPAEHLRGLASLYGRIEHEATDGIRPIEDLAMRSLGRAFEDAALKLSALAVLVTEIAEIAKDPARPVALAAALKHAAMTVAHLSELTHQVARILDLRLQA